MTPVPLVQFKAGKCDVNDDTNPWRVQPQATPGFIYLYKEEDLTHFCWRPRVAPIDDPGSDALDLIMVDGDGQFEPLEINGINGRFYRLGFQSSSAKHFFWLQSKAQNSSLSDSEWSDQDHVLGKIVTEILSGEEVNAQETYQMAASNGRNVRQSHGDTEMRDADDEADGHHRPSGPGETTEEGRDSHQEGEDGARNIVPGRKDGASRIQIDTQSAVDNFLKSLQGSSEFVDPSSSDTSSKVFTTLPDLLQPQAVIDTIENTSSILLDELLSELPVELLSDSSKVMIEPSIHCITMSELLEKLSLERKREIVGKVIRSPQFTQSLASLTSALRDGGLPAISEILGVQVKNGGFLERHHIPIAGSDAIEAFIGGIRDMFEGEDVLESS